MRFLRPFIWYPHFARCTFNRCKLKGVSFNDASFSRTRFIGKLADCTFSGLYHEASTGHLPIDRVDFSEAILGEFVTFENCDLANSIPPTGFEFSELLDSIYADDPTTLSTGSRDRIVLRRFTSDK